MSENETLGLQQVRWMARRGMLELDLLFNRFIDNKFQQLTIEEQYCLVDMLQEEDTTLYDWFFSSAVPEQEDWVKMVALVKEYS
ncbi:MAG: hypothetical protein CMF55_05485 [Legionellales bacterium]|nr:hypothetical protein [Legionellales bacterium]HAG61946.1 hypothetical protein [Coxiellaceae bacterium]|tara:strand:+ start:743 stop:994 length:252 start_codon:yes stop_codon:yes gene_type:complete